MAETNGGLAASSEKKSHWLISYLSGDAIQFEIKYDFVVGCQDVWLFDNFLTIYRLIINLSNNSNQNKIITTLN